MTALFLCMFALYISEYIGEHHQTPWDAVAIYWGLVALNYLLKKRGKKDE